MSKRILVLNGPNLNMLGSREPDIYGVETLAGIEAAAARRAGALDLQVEFRQTNSEGELVDWVQQAADGGFSALIVNAGAYTHTSVALLDALLACRLPVVEVHLSNIYRRDEFRHHSYVSRAAHGMICGFGGHGYQLAVDAAARILETRKE
ncbi:MAG: type II 3-dehydroquinate dehydratase [Rhodospirillales bacterium RIFCSPLOWO2_12_FULL_58_28]|nr:MAG: type II 3-dehydroquinate dehydratase [Rhodospirillales bacterium RIFCSPLOWO2_02_FULL_58_16]OHC78745.1 MAG: type II 3-dehydroquinate dehydratase [Rhodospirillales bacterium RIFCSPLOWO2_12_FULL_58_28]